LKPWDAAAGLLLVEEAGGRVTDFRGRPYRLTDTRQTLASNGRLHGAMLRLLKTSKS
jgi:myo-inositol-1(or 4)-monophosphatase